MHTKLVQFTIVLFAILAPIEAHASPEERAQMFKARALKQLLGDGWSLVQESQSQLVFERPMTGWGAPLVQALTTGANGTNPVIRWTLTFVPMTEHYTNWYANAVMTSQNAFGQATTIPLKNPKNRAYIESQLRVASDSMPARYRREEPAAHR